MKRTPLILLTGFILAFTHSCPAQAETRAESLFQEAMIKESGERDPEAAIKLYQQAIDASGNNHRLAAKARLHMGACNELLGRPKEAEALYLAVIHDPAKLPAQDVQSAQANLERLQVQEKRAREEAERARPMVLVKEFHDSRFAFIAGPALGVSSSHSLMDLGFGLRYRLSRDIHPLALFGEFGGMFPLSGSTIKTHSKPFDNSTTDTGSLHLRHQIHLALISELPHGAQKRIVPEIGIGAALTSSKIDYTSGSSGSQTQGSWGPYFTLNVRFWADKQISLLMESTYTANPYAKTVEIASPAHIQNFDFPNALWGIGAKVQVKIGSTKSVMRPKE